MDDKIHKLQIATDEAAAQVQQLQGALQDAQQRVQAAKELLKQLDPEEQARIQVNDTALPELLGSLSKCQEEYDVAVKRLETNKKYLRIIKAKISQP